jgi:hypothetical protein
MPVRSSSARVDTGRPVIGPTTGQGYYAAFVYDPDGNNIEAVCQEQRR